MSVEPVPKLRASGVSWKIVRSGISCALGLSSILLPPDLRAWAGIEREAVVVGVHTSIEIWSQAGWQAQQAAMEEQTGDIASRFTGLI